MKKFISKIPVLGTLAKKTYRKIKRIPEFTTSEEYWEQRYKLGGNSGPGSYNNLAEFKAEVINGFIKEKNIESVIEFGSGDGNQLQYLEMPKYTGYDVSETTIKNCQAKYKNDSTKDFRLVGSYTDQKADLTMSLDVIFHLVEDQVFEQYMKTLFLASSKYVIVYSSNVDNQPSASHVKHRRFTDWVEKNQQNFSLLKHIPNKYPFDGDIATSSHADFFIYEKLDN